MNEKNTSQIEKLTFSLHEANAMIPKIRRSLTLILQLQAHIRMLDINFEVTQIASINEFISSFFQEHNPEFKQNRSIIDGLQSLIDAEVENLTSLGCVIRNLEQGRVEWKSIRDNGQPMFLGWHYERDKVNYWREGSQNAIHHPIE